MHAPQPEQLGCVDVAPYVIEVALGENDLVEHPPIVLDREVDPAPVLRTTPRQSKRQRDDTDEPPLQLIERLGYSDRTLPPMFADGGSPGRRHRRAHLTSVLSRGAQSSEWPCVDELSAGLATVVVRYQETGPR